MLTTEQLAAKLSSCPAALGGKAVRATPCMHMLGVGFEVCSWAPDLSVCSLRLHGALPGLLAQIPALPAHVSQDGTLNHLLLCREEVDAAAYPTPLPRLEGGPLPSLSGVSMEGRA